MAVNKKYLSILGLSLISLLIGSIIGFTIAQSNNTFTITSGIYPSGADYTIYKEDSIYYAKNAYGYNVYSGTNASEIINNALIDASTINGSVYLASISYSLTNGIEIPSYVTLEGSGISNTVLNFIDSGNEAIILNSGSEIRQIQLIDLGTWNESLNLENVIGSHISSLRIVGFTYGILMHYTWYVWLEDIFIGSCDYGIYTEITDNGNNFDLRQAWIHDSVYAGIYLNSPNGIVVSDTEILSLNSDTAHGLYITESDMGVQQFIRLIIETKGMNGVNALTFSRRDTTSTLGWIFFYECSFLTRHTNSYVIAIDGTSNYVITKEIHFDGFMVHHSNEFGGTKRGVPINIINAREIILLNGKIIQSATEGRTTNISMIWKGVELSQVENVNFYSPDHTNSQTWNETSTAVVTSNYNIFHGNIVYGNTTNPTLNYVGVNNLVTDNIGYP